MLKKYSVTVLVLCLCFGYGSSIYCYECSSWNNSMCLDPSSYDKETLARFLPVVECRQGVLTADPLAFFCRKITQTVLRKGFNSDVRITRGCGWVRSHRECYKADNEDHLETVCQCFADGCNGAQGIRISGVFTFAVCILGIVLG